jgi:uncharacterized protein YjbJ (UPF0337 family)
MDLNLQQLGGRSNRRLQAEGRGDQAKGEVKQAGENIKDAFGH